MQQINQQIRLHLGKIDDLVKLSRTLLTVWRRRK